MATTINEKGGEGRKEPEEIIDIEGAEESTCPDGGWGWIVTIGCFIIRTCRQLIQPSFGLLFSGLLLEIGASSSTTAWIFNINIILEQFTKFFVGPLGDVIGWRLVVISAGLMAFFSCLALMYAYSVIHLILFFSIGIGLACGLSACTSQLVITSYFDKNRGKAMGLMLLGVSMGQFASPILITFLLETYGYKGALLIISSILLNVCAAGIVMHPIKWHMPKTELVSDSTFERQELSYSKGLMTTKENIQGSQSNCSCITNFVYKTLKVIVAVLTALKYNLRALGSYRAVMFSLNVSMYMAGYANFYMMIPFKIQNNGYSLKDAAVCLSVVAIFSGISRTVSPILSDCKKFNKKLVYTLSIAGLAISQIGFTFVSSLRWMLTISSFIGVLHGSVISLYTLVMIDTLGLKLYKASYGISGILIGCNAITIGPLLGLVRDISGSYDISMRFSTGGSVMSLLLILLLPIAIKRDEAKMKS